ncbi:hypothetical protein BGX27_000103 [Mortierella sp. AM989]|nr:hypothetical protein BGX27_000103 [Mortierella sp. AM989]
MDAKQPTNNNSHSASSSKGKGLSLERAGSSAGPQTGGVTNLIGSIASSAKNIASALDPRQTDMLTQHNSLGSASGSSNSAVLGSSSKTSTSSASRTFQHATNAMETLGSSRINDLSAESTQPTGFRSTSSFSQQTGAVDTGAGGAMDWDNFLASSESTVQDDLPYNPPSMSSFSFNPLAPETSLSQQYQQAQQDQQRIDSRTFEPAYQAHLSQPMRLTPANHSAFLEYLKSTADGATQQQQPYPQTQSSQYQQRPIHSEWNNITYSIDVQRQQHMDGDQVLAFLDSTSYSEFVDQIEAEGIEKHQQIRREFVYSEATLGPRTQSLFSALQLIQDLPSERQDIVQYLLQQGTYSDDVWGRPFGHDTEREEAGSLAATRAEQDQFLQQQQQSSYGVGDANGDDATTAEMERVLKQIVDDAKKEVKTGETDGKALNRLMMVRSHITMGTKL